MQEMTYLLAIYWTTGDDCVLYVNLSRTEFAAEFGEQIRLYRVHVGTFAGGRC